MTLIEELRNEADKLGNIVFLSDQNERNNVHHVHELDVEQKELEKHTSTVESVIERAKENAGLYACSEFIEAMKFIREHADEEWVRLRVRIKKKKPSGVLLADIDDATRPESEGSGERSVASALVKLVVDRC